MKKNKILGIILSVIVLLEVVFLFIPFFTNKSGNYSPITSYFKFYLPITKHNFMTTMFLVIYLIELGLAISTIVSLFKKDEKRHFADGISLIIISILFLFIFTMYVAVPK